MLHGMVATTEHVSPSGQQSNVVLLAKVKHVEVDGQQKFDGRWVPAQYTSPETRQLEDRSKRSRNGINRALVLDVNNGVAIATNFKSRVCLILGNT